MNRAARVVTITLGLMGVGAVAGALCGAVIPPVVLLLTSRSSRFFSAGTGQLAVVGAAFGALGGAVAGPAVAWGLLRRAPLGKAMLWGAVGTVIGAVVGEWLAPFNPYSRAIPGVIAGAMLGFIGASVALRLRLGRTRPSSSKASNVR